MKIPGIKTARRLSRWAQARLLGGALILGYHRIAEIPHDEDEICVSPNHFAEQMDALRNYANVISLSKLVQYLKEGTLPSRSVAVTFDDGYADNLHEARPILERYDVPATIFVCSGFLGHEFWWDELLRLVMSSTADPHQLRLSPLQRDRPALWKDADADPALPERRVIFRDLYHRLRPLDVLERSERMTAIRSWAQLPVPESVSHRSLNPEELLQLSNCELIGIASHTRNHPMLPGLPLHRQEEEIVGGRQDVEAIIGRPVTGFSYPNGQATRDAKSILDEKGFSYACTSLEDAVRPGSDVLELSRYWQKDVNGDRFMQNLKKWLPA